VSEQSLQQHQGKTMNDQQQEPTLSQDAAVWQRVLCFFGKHPGVARTWGPYPYPDAYNCTRCRRLLYMIDEHVTLTIDGRRVGKGGVRYANLDQWLEERG
jgi:predicted acetyltransferase